MNHRDYIDSGILQDYCLGLLPDAEKQKVEEMCRLYPEIKTELALVQKSLEKQAMENQVKPRAALKDTIWNTLHNLDKEQDLRLDNLSVITKYTDASKWLNMIKPLLPDTLDDEEFSLVLQDTGKVMQKILRSRKSYYPDEIHDDLYEGLLILEGECLCQIGDGYYQYGPGDFIDIPLKVIHNLKVLTPNITLIVQHVAA